MVRPLVALLLLLPFSALAQEEVARTIRLTVRVEGDGRDARVELPLVQTDPHQTVVSENLVTRGFTLREVRDGGNRTAVLTYPKLKGPRRITYEFTVRTRPSAAAIPGTVLRDPRSAPAEDAPWLGSTRHLQVDSPLLRERFAKHLLATRETDAVRAAWELTATGYVHKRGGANTVLKATRTGVADDRGLDRLLTTYLRLGGVPARPVVGLDIVKSTGSRVAGWVEARVDGAWYPLSVSRARFGELPARWVKLAHGDRPLVIYDGVGKLTYRVKVTE